MHPSPASCANATLNRYRVRPMAPDRGCPRVLHRPIPALPGRFATDVAANHAVPSAPSQTRPALR